MSKADLVADLVAEIEEFVAKTADERIADALVDDFAASVRRLHPCKATATMALTALVRSLIPDDATQGVWLAAFASMVADIKIKRHDDGSPVLHDRMQGGMLQ